MSRAILEGDDDIAMPDHPQFRTILQATMDLQELWIIWHVLQPNPTNENLWNRVRALFGGPTLLKDAADKRKPRDTQFELLSQAILERAGLQPTHNRDNVDFVCQLGNRRFVVEAKRLTKASRLDDRARDAASQISNSGHPGFIFLDYSEPANPRHDLLAFDVAPSDEQVTEARNNRFNYFWHHNGDYVRRRCNGKGVLGFVLFDHLISQAGLRQDDHCGIWQLWITRDHKILGDSSLAEDVFQLLKNIGLPQVM